MPVPKVLIADDSPLVLRIIEKMLAGAGYAVLTARDGIEAIEKAVADDVDLVILDVMMPRMNGYQACRILKTEPTTKSVPVIILTSKDQAGDRFWGLETGADYYVTKDSEPLRILELVRNILATEPGRTRIERDRGQDDGRGHPVPGQRPAGPEAVRSHDPLRDRPGGAQPRAVRRDVRVRDGAGGPRRRVHGRGDGLRRAGRRGGRARSSIAGPPRASWTRPRRVCWRPWWRPAAEPLSAASTRGSSPIRGRGTARRKGRWAGSRRFRWRPATAWPACSS